ncbi:hypothetical protein [Metabacillus arenae]|uniref:Lipoprotein n=1 Tax=Metabacillus arenae TaxID=2771434 RepID=A0A926S142_9BACI|nr:hypothetical protein [Metabacillus arenae]MBD1380644.1 hypothetical protein [Metabacillus arenae]
MKDWLIKTLSTLFAVTLITGCAVNDDQDPAPPENGQNEEQAPNNEDMNNMDENVPGVDEDDTINQDDEKDKKPDPEDPIEDPQDIGDENRRDD